MSVVLTSVVICANAGSIFGHSFYVIILQDIIHYIICLHASMLHNWCVHTYPLITLYSSIYLYHIIGPRLQTPL